MACDVPFVSVAQPPISRQTPKATRCINICPPARAGDASRSRYMPEGQQSHAGAGMTLPAPSPATVIAGLTGCVARRTVSVGSPVGAVGITAFSDHCARVQHMALGFSTSARFARSSRTRSDTCAAFRLTFTVGSPAAFSSNCLRAGAAWTAGASRSGFGAGGAVVVDTTTGAGALGPAVLEAGHAIVNPASCWQGGFSGGETVLGLVAGSPGPLSSDPPASQRQ